MDHASAEAGGAQMGSRHNYAVPHRLPHEPQMDLGEMWPS